MEQSNSPNTTFVYVRWYNSVIQGEVVPNTTPNDKLLGSMVAVRIPLQGGHAVALFTPAHVYPSAEAASVQNVSKSVRKNPQSVPINTENVPKVSSNVQEQVSAWQRIQDFKQAHWNAERNWLNIDALEDFYQMFRDAVAEEIGYKIEPTFVSPSNIVAVMKHVVITTLS